MRKNGMAIKIKKFFVNSSVEALIPFNEGHQWSGSIETACTFTEGRGLVCMCVCGERGMEQSPKERIFSETEK